VRAPIIGRVAKVFVAPGDIVAKGDRIAVVEAMKMEHVLPRAPAPAAIDKLAVREGDQVTLGALIARWRRRRVPFTPRVTSPSSLPPP